MMRKPSLQNSFDSIRINFMAHKLEDTHAFVHTFRIDPTGSGSLNGLTFAAKDLIDLSGQKTGCGNPRWQETHPPAAANAICIAQLLAAGATCIGKTITEELAYSLIGENYFYGTPVNCKAPDRVPGGSSSGSASAVSCGVVDFALGTDTGGSVRVPASNCGIWGWRPTHGIVSVAGVCPLSISFDTVGVLASSSEILERAALALLSVPACLNPQPKSIYLVREAFDLCDEEVIRSLQDPIQKLRAWYGNSIREISIREIDREKKANQLENWYEIYKVLQRAEAWNSLGAWIESEKPEMGSMIAESLELAKSLDRSLIPAMRERREDYFRKMLTYLGPGDLLCIPTVCSPAPLKGTIQIRAHASRGYYVRVLSLNAIAGAARMPQISMPLADVGGAPVGLSLIGRWNEDAFLLAAAKDFTAKTQRT
jgi:amidase